MFESQLFRVSGTSSHMQLPGKTLGLYGPFLPWFSYYHSDNFSSIHPEIVEFLVSSPIPLHSLPSLSKFPGKQEFSQWASSLTPLILQMPLAPTLFDSTSSSKTEFNCLLWSIYWPRNCRERVGCLDDTDGRPWQCYRWALRGLCGSRGLRMLSEQINNQYNKAVVWNYYFIQTHGVLTCWASTPAFDKGSARRARASWSLSMIYSFSAFHRT